MIKGLNHIGIVVRSIDDTLATLSAAFGAVDVSPDGRKSFPQIGQTSALVKIGDFTLELMEPYGDVKGTCTKYLERHGEGLHHISLITDDIDAEDEHLAANGIHVLAKAPKGIKADRVMFTHPKETASIVFEITEPYTGDKE
jgi:methylmalonyl-CoA epimerase